MVMAKKTAPASKPHAFSWSEKTILSIAVVVLALLSSFFALDLRAQSTPTGFVTPGVLDGLDKCNLGLIGACGDQSEYVSGPESVLESWLFAEGIPWWISFFLTLSAGVSVLMIMIGGVMVTTGADSDIRKKGVKTIIWALLGLVIALFSFVIVGILENIPLPGSTAPLPEGAS